MKRKTIFASATAVVLAAVVAAPVFAHSAHSGYASGTEAPHMRQGIASDAAGPNMPGGMNMMQMMRMMHSQGGDMGMGGMPMGAGMFGDRNGAFVRSLDADNDGQVSKQEFSSGLLDILKSGDSDGNGTLSIDEFEPAYAAAIRWQMVDQFQSLDDNGDGQVTTDEINAAADRTDRMWMRGGPGYGMPMNSGGMPGNQPAAGPRGQSNMPMMDSGDTDNN